MSTLPSFTYTGALQPQSTGVGVYASVSRPKMTLRWSTGVDTGSGGYIQVNREANPLFLEVAALINAVSGTAFQTTNRVDLQAIYISDVIRVNTITGRTHVAGGTNFSRLSFIGGDTIANGAGVQIPAGWPNGHRFGDDVVDIALTAIASGPGFSTITVVGDNVAANDQVYNQTFPFAATPNDGIRNSKDSGPNVGVQNKANSQDVGF